MRFVHVSDVHLVPGGQTLHGLDPVMRFRECVADINTHAEHLEFCVITGDLCDRGDEDSYRVLRELLGELRVPYHLMVGNHDRREAFLGVFPDARTDGAGFVQDELVTDSGVFLFLDSVDEGEHAGLYCERRSAWLTERLARAGDGPVYVFMHHPPFEIGFASLDRMKLRDGARFLELLESAGNVRHLFFGHVHRPLSGSWGSVPFSALPGTNHQIATDFEMVAPMPYSHGPPAYAIVDVEADRTLVHLSHFLDDYPRRNAERVWEPRRAGWVQRLLGRWLPRRPSP